ncbi:MAG: hypothetical protein V1660_00490 [archaeon]
MNRFAKAGLAGLLALSLSGCSSSMTMSLAEIQRRPIIVERVISKNEKQEKTKTIVDENSNIVDSYSIENVKQQDSILSFDVRKSQKEEITRNVLYSTKTKDLRYREVNDLKSGNTISRNFLDSVEGKTILENRIEKEEFLIKENENVANAKTDVFFFEPTGPVGFTNVDADKNGHVYFDFNGFKSEKLNNKLFFSEQFILQKLLTQVTEEGKNYYDLDKIVNSNIEVIKQKISISVMKDGNQKKSESADLIMKKPDFEKIYSIFKSDIMSKLVDYISPINVNFEILDEETRRPLEDIIVRIIPIRTMSKDDIEKKELELRKKYFQEDSNIFDNAKIIYGSDIILSQDAKPPVSGYQKVEMIVPKNSVYKFEFIDGANEARYKAFVTQPIKFEKEESAEILLERIAERVQIDNRNSRGSYNSK